MGKLQQKREDISNEYKWDLTLIYKSDEDWYKNHEEVSKIIEKIKDYNVIWIYDYVEASTLSENLMRREGQINTEVFDRMIKGFDWPMAHEYNYIKFYTN